METILNKMWVIRNDDVLLVNPITGSMKNSLRSGNSFFDWFKITDKIFEENNIHCILSVLAEGIDVWPEWVSYIKERMYRYKIEMHGWDHAYPHAMTAEEGYEKLSRARDKIEATFDVKVEHWYVPNGRLYFPKWGPEVCEKLGVQFNYKGDSRDFYQLHIHYWNTRDIQRLKNIINNPKVKICRQIHEVNLRSGLKI